MHARPEVGAAAIIVAHNCSHGPRPRKVVLKWSRALARSTCLCESSVSNLHIGSGTVFWARHAWAPLWGAVCPQRSWGPGMFTVGCVRTPSLMRCCLSCFLSVRFQFQPHFEFFVS